MTLTDASYQSQGAEAPEPPGDSYYDAPDGTPCPVCRAGKPTHERGCSEAAEGEPAYRLTPAHFDPWADA